MASGTQLGATHARINFSLAGSSSGVTGWSDTTLPVVDVSCKRTPEVWVFGHPFTSHVVIADWSGDAYQEYIDTIADHLIIDEETLKGYITDHDSDGNPEYAEVEWTSGGEPMDTTYVGAFQVDLAAITWLYRKPEAVAA